MGSHFWTGLTSRSVWRVSLYMISVSKSFFPNWPIKRQTDHMEATVFSDDQLPFLLKLSLLRKSFPSLLLKSKSPHWSSLILERATCQERVTWRSATTTTSWAGGNRGTSLRCFENIPSKSAARPCRTGTGSTDGISAGTAAWTLCPLTLPASSRCSRRLWREVSELKSDLSQLFFYWAVLSAGIHASVGA